MEISGILGMLVTVWYLHVPMVRQAEQNAAWKVLEKLKLIKVVPLAAAVEETPWRSPESWG